jgi:hypothetical protein
MQSAPKALLGYAYKHVKTTLLLRSADAIDFFILDDLDQTIKAAESLLIYSAISAGAPLINIQERQSLASDPTSGQGLARQIVSRSKISDKQWLERIDVLLSRFSGECC